MLNLVLADTRLYLGERTTEKEIKHIYYSIDGMMSAINFQLTSPTNYPKPSLHQKLIIDIYHSTITGFSEAHAVCCWTVNGHCPGCREHCQCRCQFWMCLFRKTIGLWVLQAISSHETLKSYLVTHTTDVGNIPQIHLTTAFSSY